jgi:signal transduction histidine kinase
MYVRLQRFLILRWFVFAGLVLTSIIGKWLTHLPLWPYILWVAIFVGSYNVIIQIWLGAFLKREKPFSQLKACAIIQMVMDLIALMITSHFTGGMHSPVLPFFVFHMAIGTIMIKPKIVYCIAGATCLGMSIMHLLERTGILAFHPLDPELGTLGTSGDLNLIGLSATVFGMVYLTASVTNQFKLRNIELHETSDRLKEQSQKLKMLLKEKEELERRKSHYMRISAHQLRSPLGTIKTSLQVMTDGYLEPNSERGRRLLKGVMHRVDSLLAIVNDLLELAKMREGRAKAQWVRNVSINQILADIFDESEIQASEKKVELEPLFLSGRNAILDWGVPPDLVYALSDLVANGIKYSSHEGGKVTTNVEINEGTALITISDNGIGIPEDWLEDIFLEFVRAPNAKHHQIEGTGLGLSIVYEAVNMHGGSISVESTEGVGTTFKVTLPLHYTPPEVKNRIENQTLR